MIDLNIEPVKDPEPLVDHGHCLDCGCDYPLAEMESEIETESVDGHVIASYSVFQCSNCHEWNVECEYSEDQYKKWKEWSKRREVPSV